MFEARAAVHRVPILSLLVLAVRRGRVRPWAAHGSPPHARWTGANNHPASPPARRDSEGGDPPGGPRPRAQGHTGHGSTGVRPPEVRRPRPWRRVRLQSANPADPAVG